MIRKFLTLKNIGKFESYQASGKIDLTDLTLIYGENGRGKSTLCAVLRSLAAGNPQFLIEKKTANAKGQIEARILVNSTQVHFDGVKWNASYANLEVFDSAFVNDNVFSGDTVELDHKRNLHLFAVGEQGVQLAKAVEQLDESIRAKLSDIRTKEGEIKALGLGATTPSEFVSFVPDADVSTKLHQAELKVQSIKQSASIKARQSFAKIELPEAYTHMSSLLAK